MIVLGKALLFTGALACGTLAVILCLLDAARAALVQLLRGILGRIVHYVFPSPVAVVWLVAVVAVGALATMQISLPGGW